MTEQQDINSQQANSDSERQSDIVTIVLTADNHLGYDATGQNKREERQQRLRDTLQQAVTFAVGHKVDLFIQAGDLFDTITPTERDRSFVASRLAQLKQAGVRTIALGGIRDTPIETQRVASQQATAPQMSYAQLGALQYLPPLHKQDEKVEPLLLNAHGVKVGICGLGTAIDQEGDPLARLRVQIDIESAAIPLLVLHAPIEGLGDSSSPLESRTQVSRASIEQQHTFRYILAGYHHAFSHIKIGQTDVIVAGATSDIPNSLSPHAAESNAGFVFMGLAAGGVRWCNHIEVDALQTKHVSIATTELWSDTSDKTPTERILERLRPLCDAETTIQLRLEGDLTRRQYHQLDLNTLRRYGEEHCFSLLIEDSGVSLVPEQDAPFAENTEKRFSLREELIAVAAEWIADTSDGQEQNALRITQEELLLALDDSRGKR